jgi:hypothetical protein
MYILKENAGCQIYRPTWNGTRTIFRPFPGRDPENPEAWDPFRLSDEDGDWGDWIRRYDMAFSFGNPGITFILKNPLDKTIDDQQNPVWMLHRSITQAVKSGQGHPSWNPLIFGAAGRGAPLSAPKDGYIMQGILMEHKSQPQNPPRGCMMEHQPMVLLMSQSAGAALLDKLGEKNQEGGWLFPDVTNLDAGMFVQFHQAGTQYNAAAGQPAQQMGANMTIGGGGGVADNNRYEVEVLSQYNGISPTYTGVHEVAQAHVKPWDEIVRIPSIEDQVKMLCGAGIPATAIVYALGDVYQEFIPQHIFDQARAQQTTTTVPFQSVNNPMAGGGQDNPMGAPRGNPMGSPQTSTQADPGMPPVDQTPPAEETQPVGNTQAAPAGSPMAAEQPPARPSAEEQGFDPQPTHADPRRSVSTQEALKAARERAAAAQKGG